MPAGPRSPSAAKQNVVPRSAVIVMPETGCEVVPTSPTIRPETTTKKKLNTTARSVAGRER